MRAVESGVVGWAVPARNPVVTKGEPGRRAEEKE